MKIRWLRVLNIITVIIIGFIIAIMIRHEITKEDSLSVIKDRPGEVKLSLLMDEEKALDCEIKAMSIKTKDNKILCLNNLWWIRGTLGVKKDTFTIAGEEYKISKDITLGAMKFNESLSYIKYSNEEETGNRELVLYNGTNDVIDTQGMESEGIRIKYKNSLLQNRVFATSYNKTQLVLSETLSGGKLEEVDMIKALHRTEDSLYLADNDKWDIKITLDNLGDISVNEWSGWINNPELSYLRDDGVIKIKSLVDDRDYIYISCLNSAVFNFTPEEFKPTGIENLYTTVRNEQNEGNEFEAIGLLSESSFYIIQFRSEISEALKSKLIVQLGLR